MLVQALVDEQQPRVFQLPYVDDELFKEFDKQKIYTIQEFIKMDTKARRCVCFVECMYVCVCARVYSAFGSDVL